MTDRRCSGVRRDLLAGSADGAHLAQCPACAAFAARLAVVDRSLSADARGAAGAALPAALRTSILRAALPAGRPTVLRTRGRLLEIGLRVAAVAAVLLVIVYAAPDTLLAGELDLTGLEGITGRLAEALSAPPSVAWPAFAPQVTAPPLAQPSVLAVGSGVLLVLGFVLLRRGPEA